MKQLVFVVFSSILRPSLPDLGSPIPIRACPLIADPSCRGLASVTTQSLFQQPVPSSASDKSVCMTWLSELQFRGETVIEAFVLRTLALCVDPVHCLHMHD
jgi:hypothetical protein